MHQLFVEVLTKKDLSRAGDLFSIEDKSIVGDLSELIATIQQISSAHDFCLRHNDQSVVEICLTRITSAIRDSGTIEKHASALVNLLESCLHHNLTPREKDEDPPHAKIAGDVVSCIFLNHSKKSVMKLAIPVAVKLLHRGNRELSRNLSSYLSLAAINNADILAPHVQPIMDSIIGGNYSLARVLPKIYTVNKEPIHEHVMALVCLLDKCDTPDKLSLLNLFSLISKAKPSILESNLPQLSECLHQSQTAYQTLQIFLDLATNNPVPFLEYIHRVMEACETQTGMLSLGAQFLGIIAKHDIDRARMCLDFFVNQLSNCDLSTLIALLREIKSVVEVYPILLPSFLPVILAQTEYSSSNTVQNYLSQLTSLNHHVSSSTSSGSSSSAASSAITVVRVNNNNNHHHHHHDHLSYSHPLPMYSMMARSTVPPPSGDIVTYASSSARMTNISGLKLNTSNNHVFHRSIPRLHVVNGGHIIGRHLSNSSNGVHMRSLTALQAVASGSSRPQVNRMSSESINAGVNNASGSQKSASSSCGYLTTMAEREAVMKSSKTVATSVDSQLQSTNNIPFSIPSNLSHYNLNSGRASSRTEVTTLQNNIAKLRSLEKNPPKDATDRGKTEYNDFPARDTVQHFCEKHIDKIKAYMSKIFVKIPLPDKCTIEDRKGKKITRLHFLCQSRGEHCLYPRTFFVTKTKNPRHWIHLMFLNLQAKASTALSTNNPEVMALKSCWDSLKMDNKTFLTLVTSSFPSPKDQDILMHELRVARYFDVFEFNAIANSWGCFLCNHPDRATEFIQNEPVIEGQLKEKKGKWKLFKRWRTKYFTLSGLQLTYREEQPGDRDEQAIGVQEIRSVKALGSSRGRKIPKAFEIFTNEDKTFILKAKNSRNTEQWVQCLSIAMAHCQAKESS